MEVSLKLSADDRRSSGSSGSSGSDSGSGSNNITATFQCRLYNESSIKKEKQQQQQPYKPHPIHTLPHQVLVKIQKQLQLHILYFKQNLVIYEFRFEKSQPSPNNHSHWTMYHNTKTTMPLYGVSGINPCVTPPKNDGRKRNYQIMPGFPGCLSCMKMSFTGVYKEE